MSLTTKGGEIPLEKMDEQGQQVELRKHHDNAGAIPAQGSMAHIRSQGKGRESVVKVSAVGVD